jgi:hypothetical protein
MKNLTLLLVLSLLILTVAGCNQTGTGTTANSNANSTTAANNTSSSPSSAPAANSSAPAAKSDLKPADIDPNKPVPIADVKAAYIADKAAWHGKQVSVTGDYFGKGKTTKGAKAENFYVSITDSGKKMMGTCHLESEASDEISKQPKDHVFKGTIVDEKGLIEQVVLRPCEIVK